MKHYINHAEKLILSVKGRLIRLLITSIFALCIGFTVNAQQSIPEQCIQMPERKDVCPNILYKRSPVEVPQYDLKKGEIVCICMADFSSLRIAANDDEGKVKQMVALTKASVKLHIEENALLEIIRK